MESRGFNAEHTPRTDGSQSEVGFETERRVGERSRLSRLAHGRIGRLGMTMLLFTSMGAEVACAKGGDNPKEEGKSIVEDASQERAFREFAKQLASIPDNPKAESVAQNRAMKRQIAKEMIRAFLNAQGNSQEANEMLNRMIRDIKELAWLREGKVVNEVTQSSQRTKRESLGTTETRATDLLKSFQGLIASPDAYRRDIERYFNTFLANEKQKAIDALTAAMQDADLINKLPSDARKALQRAIHEHTKQ